jgi:hypothetical protein
VRWRPRRIRGSQGGTGGPAPPPGSPPRYCSSRSSCPTSAQNVDYDLAGVEALATSYRGGADATFGPNEKGTQVPEATGVTTTQRIPFPDAVACLDRAFTPATGSQGLPGQLVRVIQARFRGMPAVLGVYLIGPGAGQPTDIVRVLVASSRGCTILTSTQATT